jgi:hypothetical protein
MVADPWTRRSLFQTFLWDDDYNNDVYDDDEDDDNAEMF